MKIWEIIQLGDTEQCEDNGVYGYEYSFGINFTRPSIRSYLCKLESDPEPRSWGVKEKYATNFKLTLVFAEDSTIPF